MGSIAPIKEDARESWGTAWIERMRQDLRFAVRLIIKAPGFVPSRSSRRRSVSARATQSSARSTGFSGSHCRSRIRTNFGESRAHRQMMTRAVGDCVVATDARPRTAPASRASQHSGDRRDGRPLGRVLGAELPNHPDGPLACLGGMSTRWCHRLHQRMGPPTIPVRFTHGSCVVGMLAWTAASNV